MQTPFNTPGTYLQQIMASGLPVRWVTVAEGDWSDAADNVEAPSGDMRCGIGFRVGATGGTVTILDADGVEQAFEVPAYGEIATSVTRIMVTGTDTGLTVQVALAAGFA